MKKSIVLLVVILSLAFAAVAGAQDTYKIGYACNNYNDTFQTYIMGYADAYAAENGVELVLADGRDDEMKQMSDIENFIADGVDALIVIPVNPQGVEPIIDKAAEAEIPLIFVNRNPFIDPDTAEELEIPEGVYYVGSNEVDAGNFQAQFVVDQLGEDAKCGYVVLMGQLSNTATPGRTGGNKEIFDLYPGYEFLAEQTGNWQRDQAVTIVENWITAYGDQLCAVMANNDEMALGAVEALETAGMKDDVIVAGVDLIDDAIVAIKEGRLDFSAKQDGQGQGEGAVKTAVAVLNGEEVEKWTVIPFIPVSAENVEDFE